MNELSREQREIQYEKASEAAKNLYGSEQIGELLRGMFDKYHLREESYKAFANVAGDIILGFHSVFETQQLLMERMGLPPELAGPLAQELTEILGTLMPGQQPSISADAQTLAEQATPPAQAQSPVPPAESAMPTPDKTEEQKSAIPGYQKPLTNTPRYGGDDPYHEPIA